MAKETSSTETVTQTSSGTVKLDLEEYNDLTRRANRPQNVTYTKIVKTQEMAAQDRVIAGGLFMGGGASLLVLGAIQWVIGRRQRQS